jgi:uncharacterized protein (DUF362 family)
MPSASKSVVVIEHAPGLDYTRDYVSLPHEYGLPAYETRQDVQTIREVVFANLRKLDSEIHFTEKLHNRKVLVKPNLVTVFHDLGLPVRDYPESTDPRVLDAVILFLLQYTRKIFIVESSGRGMPTRAAFHIAGLDRLAKHRQVGLVALEEQPIDRYLLPRARIMHEIVIPRIFSEVVTGEAFYISMPKMKTNLYTGVTLGSKNSMGCLSYNLRQRNHNHAIDQKLVDILHLIKADLIIIDGIVGGEGNCPAPVEPVQSRVIISGNHSVETDRVAIRMMGFDPAEIRLMRVADENGFGDPGVSILGEQKVTAFRPADPSLLGSWMHENFPNVRVLIGHNRGGTPQPAKDNSFDQAQLSALECVCRGGCLASTRYAFEMLKYEGKRTDFKLTVIIGAGLNIEGNLFYYDASGQPFTLEQISAISGKKVAIGTCTRHLEGILDRFVDGCMPFPNSPHMVIHELSHTTCVIMSLKNKYLLPALFNTLQVCKKRKALLRSGQRIDIPLQHADKCFPTREFSLQEQQQDYIFELFPVLTRAEIQHLCAAENRSVLATFRP